MKAMPTEADYQRLKQAMLRTDKCNTYDLLDMGYKGKDLQMYVQYRIDTMVEWLEDFVELLDDRPFFIGAHMDYHLCLKSAAGYDYQITAIWTPTMSYRTDYMLRLSWQESFERSEMPTVERVEGDMPFIPYMDVHPIYNNEFGYETLARQIIAIDSC